MPVFGILALCCPGELTAARETGGSASLLPTAERQALIALYNSTSGDGWTDNSGWKTPPLDTDGFALPGTESTWYGLTVDSGTQTVTGIDFTGNNLVGTIPAALGDLAGLTDLILSGNQLTGSIPVEIGGLIALLKIDLSYNQLTGSLPATLGNLTFLQRLYATNNQLSGSIPVELGNMTNLTYIYLNTNQLSGSIPAELGNMSNLRHLFLYSNELIGAIPPELGNAISLQSIVLRYNQLSGEIPAELGHLTNLLVLRLGDNQLSGEIPAELGNLTNLQSLRLAHNHLSGEIPDTLGNLTQLWEMFINSNQLTGPIPMSLANLTGLTDTDIGYNALYTSDEALITFLNSKDPNWASTQTIAPTQVTATALDNAVIMISWLPVTYTADAGYYKVMISQNAGGPYTFAGQTANKTTSAVNVIGLTPGTRYYFVVRTVTNAHANNPNIVESTYSTEATAIAWLQTQVQISGSVLIDGSPLAGVAMGGLPEGTVTDALGAYSATVDVDFSGTVTPDLAGYTFDPLSRTYSHLMTNQTAQDYTATLLTYSITVTSPNGGERWSVGSSHDITWTQTGLTGAVTIDLYKGGIYQKTLGTPGATVGTLPWMIAADEVLGTDYTIRAWQSGGVSDDSDTDFSLVRSAVRIDFNRDGEEDILWRYQGTGAYQGVNCIWLLTQPEGLNSIPLGATPLAAMLAGLSSAAAPALTGETLLGAESTQITESTKATISPIRIGDMPILSKRSAKWSPMGIDRERTLGAERAESATPFDISAMRAAGTVSAAGDGPIGIASLTAIGYVYPQTVLDLGWEIAGAGDFDGDGNTDILWRNYSVGEYAGYNCIWYMNGAGGASGYSYPDRVLDLDWRIAGTGDLNGDGTADILWRNYGVGEFRGYNCIWYMSGAGVSGYCYPDRIWDLEWEIVGTGDFNRDGNTDILWRNTGAGDYGGINCIWYMGGGGVSGYGYPDRVLDLNWQIAGTGDFNKDGYADILWRYYGGGDLQGWNCVWYMQGDEMIGADYPARVPDTNWRIINR